MEPKVELIDPALAIGRDAMVCVLDRLPLNDFLNARLVCKRWLYCTEHCTERCMQDTNRTAHTVYLASLYHAREIIHQARARGIMLAQYGLVMREFEEYYRDILEPDEMTEIQRARENLEALFVKGLNHVVERGESSSDIARRWKNERGGSANTCSCGKGFR